MKRSLSWEDQLIRKFTTFYRTQRLFTMTTRACHWQSWKNLTHYTSSHSILIRFAVILFSHLHPGLPSGLLHSDVPIKILYVFVTPPLSARCPTHFNLLYVMNLIIFYIHRLSSNDGMIMNDELEIPFWPRPHDYSEGPHLFGSKQSARSLFCTH